MTAEEIVRKLTKAQRELVLASDPVDQDWGDGGYGVEIRGRQYRAASALRKLGIGDYSHGSPFGDLYFNSNLGIEVRRRLLENTHD